MIASADAYPQDADSFGTVRRRDAVDEDLEHILAGLRRILQDNLAANVATATAG